MSLGVKCRLTLSRTIIAGRLWFLSETDFLIVEQRFLLLFERDGETQETRLAVVCQNQFFELTSERTGLCFYWLQILCF